LESAAATGIHLSDMPTRTNPLARRTLRVG